MATISLCMIVGNEEGVIARCLESFKGAYDELCIVSALGNKDPDKTIEICKSFGAKVSFYINKEDFPHVDDFAAARNLAFKQATSDFVLWCDADDVLPFGMAEKIRDCANKAEADWYYFTYDVKNAKLQPVRERLMKRGTTQWRNAVHENCFPTCDIKTAFKPEIIIEHRPEGVYKSSSTDRNLNILKSKTDSFHLYAFYRHQEYFLTRQKELALEWAEKALVCPELGHVERYEILCNKLQLTDSIGEQIRLSLEALALMPDRREALAILVMLHIDVKKYAAALSYARMMLALPKPNATYWTQKNEFYGWKAYRLYATCLRLAGAKDAANSQEDLLFDKGGRKISLLHATRGRPQKAIDTMWNWLNAADKAEQIEHIFAIDDDDKETLSAAKGLRHVVVPAGGGCVRAWNAAAEISRGSVLVQLSDDWIPKLGWDTEILEAIGDLEKEYVLQISDGNREDDLLCMAILTRARYEKQGYVFYPEYKSMYSDDEFTFRAFSDGVVIRAKHIVFKHDHPFFKTGKLDADKTYAESNSPDRYDEGFKLFSKRNPTFTGHKSYEK